jgi:hypothetical protein
MVRVVHVCMHGACGACTACMHGACGACYCVSQVWCMHSAMQTLHGVSKPYSAAAVPVLLTQHRILACYVSHRPQKRRRVQAVSASACAWSRGRSPLRACREGKKRCTNLSCFRNRRVLLCLHGGAETVGTEDVFNARPCCETAGTNRTGSLTW